MWANEKMNSHLIYYRSKQFPQQVDGLNLCLHDVSFGPIQSKTDNKWGYASGHGHLVVEGGYHSRVISPIQSGYHTQLNTVVYCITSCSRGQGANYRIVLHRFVSHRMFL